MECDMCGTEGDVLRCPYCTKYFCLFHIQPETHNCEGVTLDQ